MTELALRRPVYDIKVPHRAIREQVALYAFESLSRCFDVIQ